MSLTLTVETGAIIAGANSYLSIADADDYHELRGNTAWATLDDDPKAAALVKATDFMTQMYRLRWKGARTNINQALDWPRFYASLPDFVRPYGYEQYVPNNVVPDLVKNACAELALRAASGDLYPDLTQAVARETVGPITIEYDKYSPQQKRFATIDALLAPLLLEGGSGASVRLMRA